MQHGGLFLPVAFPPHHAQSYGWELRSSLVGCGLWLIHVVSQVLSNLHIRYPRSRAENILVGYVRGFTVPLIPHYRHDTPGHSKELLLADCGATETELRRRYGDVVRVKAALGVRCLFRSSLLDKPDRRVGGHTLDRRSQSDQACSQVWI